MTWVLRLFGYPVLTFGPESLVDERTDGGCISHTGGQFELATEDYSPDYDEECPEETNGFGFRQSFGSAGGVGDAPSPSRRR